MAIRTVFLVGLLTLVHTAAPPVRACTCSATTLRSAVQTTPVIVVGTAAAATPGDGANRSVVVVEQGLKGAAAGERLTVRWRTPDNVSCHTVRLTPGRWLLFLTPGDDGLHHIGRCDQHTRRLKGGSQARVEAVKKALGVTSAAAAIAAAAPAANVALAQAWAQARDEQRVLGGAHPDPWVDAASATVTGDARSGFLVRFSSLPPAGFSHDATVSVTADGRVTVVSATATFSPD